MLTVMDTGAGPNFIRKDLLPTEADIETVDTPDICDANGHLLGIEGSIRLAVRLNNQYSIVEFYVCKTLSVPVLLGCDYCDKYVEAIFPRQRRILLDDLSSVPIVRRPSERPRDAIPLPAALQCNSKAGRKSTKIKVAKPITLQPQRQTRVRVSANAAGTLTVNTLDSMWSNHKLATMNGIVEVDPDSFFDVLIGNYSEHPIKLVKGQVVGNLEAFPDGIFPTEIPINEVLGLTPDGDEAPICKPESTGSTPTEDLPPIPDLNDDHLPHRYQQRLRRLLTKYSSMYDGSLGEVSIMEHDINLVPDARPHHQMPYRAGPTARETEKVEIEKMLDQRVIEPANSPWGSPVVFAPKKDGTSRFCVDFRRLNAVTIRDSYPLPRMDECIDSLGEAKILTTLDCHAGYWQVNIRPKDRDKTTFVTHHGTYRFRRMPFGLMNAPATFQRILDIVLAAYKWQTCLVYLDDIVIFSRDIESHFRHVEEVLMALQRANITLKLRKCDFFTEKIRYLGHIIEPGKLKIDEAVVAPLREAKHPMSKTELRSFLGLCNVYRRFVKDFSKIAAPLTALLTNDQPDKWTELTDDQISAFDTLIDRVTHPPVLSLPRPGRPYSIETDASAEQVGVVLLQPDDEGKLQPIGYWSRKLSPQERKYITTEQECLAVVWALLTLRPYLMGEPFTVYTDHNALRWLMNVTDPSSRLLRWRLRLSEFDFTVIHRKGILNRVADCLSRLNTTGHTTVDMEEDDIPSLNLVDWVEYDVLDEILVARQPPPPKPADPITVEELLNAQHNDAFCRAVRNKLERGEVCPYAENEEGILVKLSTEHCQIVVPPSLRERILQLAHFARLSAHPGGRRMYKTLRQFYYWPSLAFDCYSVVRNCISCAKNRIRLAKNRTEMKLFPSNEPLDYISIDILGELLRTPRGNRFLLVITDRFTKLTRTAPLKTISAEAVAKAFAKEWVFAYGPPTTVLSDNGKQFTANFFQSLCRILGTKNVYTTTYNPKCNGQVERFNRTILAALRHYLDDHPKDWDLFTDALTYAYNTQVHSSTNASPFELVLARKPRHLAMNVNPELEELSTGPFDKMAWLKRLRVLVETANTELGKAQNRYKKNFDKRIKVRSDNITTGCAVFLRRDGVSPGEKQHKLSPIVDGPYRVISKDRKTCVIARSNTETERVSLDRVTRAPDEVIPNTAAGPSTTPSTYEPSRQATEEEDVIDTIINHRTENNEIRYRIRWYGRQPSEDTWEPIDNLPRSQVVRYYRRKKIELPADIDDAILG